MNAIQELRDLEASAHPFAGRRRRLPGPPRSRACACSTCRQVLAGPTGGRTLAEFGADVVKINPPDEEGAGIRFSVHRYHTDVNRGKRTMLLDLKHAGGRRPLLAAARERRRRGPQLPAGRARAAGHRLRAGARAQAGHRLHLGDCVRRGRSVGHEAGLRAVRPGADRRRRAAGRRRQARRPALRRQRLRHRPDRRRSPRRSRSSIGSAPAAASAARRRSRTPARSCSRRTCIGYEGKTWD